MRPLSYWLNRYPPGFLSRQAATSFRPIDMAAEIHDLGTDFMAWLCLPQAERWNTFPLQVLSACLFGTFRFSAADLSFDLSLLELNWPAGSEHIRQCLRELQELLAPPFAVFRAVRAPLDAQSFPTSADFQLAAEHLEATKEQLRRTIAKLGAGLREYKVTQWSPTPQRDSFTTLQH